MAKSSTPPAADDPMDLGPFLQNYVMQNPFKTPRHHQQQQQLEEVAGDLRGDRALPPSRRWALRHRRRTSNSGGRSTSDRSNDDVSNNTGDDVTAWSVDVGCMYSKVTRYIADFATSLTAT